MGIWRPRPPWNAAGIALVPAFSPSIAGMAMIYPALRPLPSGVATTIQLLGPLPVAPLGRRRPRVLEWTPAALGGVVPLSNPPAKAGPPVAGVVLAKVFAVSMAASVLLNHPADARGADGSVPTPAVVRAALVTLPVGVAESGAGPPPSILLGGPGVAALSVVFPLRTGPRHVARAPISDRRRAAESRTGCGGPGRSDRALLVPLR